MIPDMVKCNGCGFNVEQKDVLVWGHESECPRPCHRCSTHCTPDVREAYRRGFNEGLDEMARAVSAITARTAAFNGLRRQRTDD